MTFGIQECIYKRVQKCTWNPQRQQRRLGGTLRQGYSKFPKVNQSPTSKSKCWPITSMKISKSFQIRPRDNSLKFGNLSLRRKVSLFITESLKPRFSRLIVARRLADSKVVSVTCAQISVSDLKRRVRAIYIEESCLCFSSASTE